MDLNQKLKQLFQLSDGILLPDEVALEEISKKQEELKEWNEEIVLKGFDTMRVFLQDLASQNVENFISLADEMSWNAAGEEPRKNLRSNIDGPSIWELTRHLSNWMKVLSPPIQALDMQGDSELIQCSKSNDTVIASLATMMLGYEEFHYLGSRELFIELLNTRRQSILRLELSRLLHVRYHDPEALRYELVPTVIENDSQFDEIMANDDLKKRFLLFIRELVVWDIVTNGEEPYKRWSGWWIRSVE